LIRELLYMFLNFSGQFSNSRTFPGRPGIPEHCVNPKGYSFLK